MIEGVGCGCMGKSGGGCRCGVEAHRSARTGKAKVAISPLCKSGIYAAGEASDATAATVIADKRAG